MHWHRFNQEEIDGSGDVSSLDYEFMRWTNVMPGDVVQAKGSMAWRWHDLSRRHESDVKFYRLHSSPVLVLSRFPGVPGEPELGTDEFATFIILTRHGLLAVIGDLTFGKK